MAREMRMEDLAWWQKTIAYEVYPKSFQDTAGKGTGTIAGITQHLDYLESLGVGAVWITPCYKSPMVDNGYDVADYYTIDPSFGDMDDMLELFDKAATRGIRIVLDLVFNHTSEQCAWFQESRSSRTNDKADWYIWRDAREDGSAPTNWRSIFGGSAWEWCEERQQYYLHTFAPQQPDLNWENPEVRSALFDVANFWADHGAGGFRIDAITYIKKPAVFADGPKDGEDGLSDIHDATANTEGILDFLHEFRSRVRDGRDIFCVGEANGVAADELSSWVGKDGVFDLLFEFNHTKVPTGGREVWCRTYDWTLSELRSALVASQEATAEDGWYPAFFENHDQPRSVVKYFREEGPTDAKAKALAAQLMTTRGTPFIFQGQELGYTNADWPSIGAFDDLQTRSQYEFALAEGLTPEAALACCVANSRDNARTPMQWDASAEAGFTTGTPWLPVHADYASQNVAAESADPNSVLTWYRRLAELRRTRPELVCGTFEPLMAHSDQILAHRRRLGEACCVTLVNMTARPAAFETSLVSGLELLASTDGMPEDGVLAPYQATVFGTK